MNNEYGGQRVRVKMSDGSFKLGSIHDRMAGKNGFIGILFRDGSFEFIDEFDVTVIESALNELNQICESTLIIVYGNGIISRSVAYELRKRAFRLIKETGWTAMHSVIIPELTRIIKDS